jgi:Domain of unknown function (DUF4157)
VVTKAGRIRKPIEGSGAAADHAEEAQETRADRQVPVPGLALPERAASESGTRVGPADDPAEAEAEATARSIVEVLRTVNPIAEPLDGSADQAGSAPAAEGGTVRRDAVVGPEGGALDGATAGAIEQLRGTGRPLPAPVRRGMEVAFGADLGDVRLHTGGTAAQLNEALQSRAFTAGRDIAFADGMPDTTTADGQQLLAHELTHVLQNRGPSPIRRTIRKQGAKTDITLAELMQRATISGSAEAIQYVLRYWETSTTKITFTTLDGLVKQAKAAAPNMDAGFAKSLQDTDELDEFEKGLRRWKTPASLPLEQALAERRRDLSNVWGNQLGSNYTLPNYTTPTHYSTPKSLLSSHAQTTGRDDGGWVTTNNPIPGSGGLTTGSTNSDLLLQGQKEGSLFQVGHGYQQICATCGHLTPASQFEVDHQQAFSEIRDNLIKLASAMTSDPSLYQSVKKGAKNFDTMFSVTGTPGKTGFEVSAYGAVVHLYSNDMTNLMRICRSCNGPWGKSDMAMFDWFVKSPYFGQPFLNAYQPQNPQLQVIARTRQGKGWGEAAREWFATHHLPVLQNLQLLAHLQELVRQRLTEQSNTGVQAFQEVNTSKKRKLEDSRDQLDLNNKGMLAPLKVEHDYQDGTLLGEKPYEFAPSSPLRMTNETIDLKKKRQLRKRNEKLAKTKGYAVGEQDGQTGVDTNRPDSTADQDDQDAYQLGYEAGLKEHSKVVENGESDALATDLTFDVKSYAPIDQVYGEAFKEMFWKRLAAWWAGHDAFTQDTGLDVGYATGERHAQALLRDYMSGYERARTDSKQQLVDSMTS